MISTSSALSGPAVRVPFARWTKPSRGTSGIDSWSQIPEVRSTRDSHTDICSSTLRPVVACPNAAADRILRDRVHPLSLYHPLAVLEDDAVGLERRAEVAFPIAAADPDLVVLDPLELGDPEVEALPRFALALLGGQDRRLVALEPAKEHRVRRPLAGQLQTELLRLLLNARCVVVELVAEDRFEDLRLRGGVGRGGG